MTTNLTRIDTSTVWDTTEAIGFLLDVDPVDKIARNEQTWNTITLTHAQAARLVALAVKGSKA